MKWVVVFVLLMSLLSVFSVSAFAEPIDVTRDLPTSAGIGDLFNVTLNINVDEANSPKSYALYETIPPGFDVVDYSGMVYLSSSRTLRLIAYGADVKDKIVTYKVKSDTALTGVFGGYSRYNNQNHNTIGDNNVSVHSNIPPKVTIITPTNTTYNITTVFLNTYAGEHGDTSKEIRESIDGNPSIKICNDCSAYARNITFTNGHHKITIYVTDYYDNIGNASVEFTINQCTPNWILNSTWSACVSNIQYKNYYDLNHCGLTAPSSVSQSCDITPPSMVTNLHTTFANESAITWEWTNPSEPDYYRAMIYYAIYDKCAGQSSCTYYYVGYVYAPEHSITIKGLNASTKYIINIITKDANGYSNSSAPGIIPSNDIYGWTTSSSEACITPTNGMSIIKNTTFCQGTYYLPDGVHFDSNNIFLDCNNSILIGSNTSMGIDLIYMSNLIVKNCNVSNYTIGIRNIYSSNNVIKGNILGGNQEGIYSSRDDKTKILNNYVHDTKKEQAYYYGIGISVFSSTNTEIINNTIVRSARSGIDTQSVVNITLINNTITDSIRSGMECSLNCKNNTIKYNHISNSNDGIVLNEMNDSIISNNNISGNHYGINLAFDSYRNKIYTNLFKQNTGYGLDSWDSDHPVSLNQIYGNQFYNTGVYDVNHDNNIYCVNGVGNFYYDGATGPTCPEVFQKMKVIRKISEPITLGQSITVELDVKDYTDSNIVGYIITENLPDDVVVVDPDVINNFSGYFHTVQKDGLVTHKNTKVIKFVNIHNESMNQNKTFTYIIGSYKNKHFNFSGNIKFIDDNGVIEELPIEGEDSFNVESDPADYNNDGVIDDNELLRFSYDTWFIEKEQNDEYRFHAIYAWILDGINNFLLRIEYYPRAEYLEYQSSLDDAINCQIELVKYCASFSSGTMCPAGNCPSCSSGTMCP